MGWEIMSASFSVALHYPNPSVITLMPHCWNVPRVLPSVPPRADSNYNTSWLLSLMPLLQGGIGYVSCDLTHLQLSFELGFKRLVTTPKRRVDGDLFEAMPLWGRGAAGGRGVAAPHSSPLRPS